MNRTIHFSVFAFLLLLALLFLLSDQLSRLSAQRSILESEKTIDRTAEEKAMLTRMPLARFRIRLNSGYRQITRQ